jgi:hypothetical protein
MRTLVFLLSTGHAPSAASFHHRDGFRAIHLPNQQRLSALGGLTFDSGSERSRVSLRSQGSCPIRMTSGRDLGQRGTHLCGSKGRERRSPLTKETIEQIERTSRENRIWGAERIRGELLKLGIYFSKRTIQKVHATRKWHTSEWCTRESHEHRP